MSQARLADSASLGQARQWLRDRVEQGAACPCCTQRAQVYRWSLYSTAVSALHLFWCLGGAHSPVSTFQLKERGHRGQGDASRLAHWGLVAEAEGRRPDGGRIGAWQVTELGQAFLFDQATVAKYAHIYDGRLLRFSGPQVGVRECCGTKFSYEELVGRYPAGPSAVAS